MFDIIFYENKRGEKPVEQYIFNLKNQQSKDARIKFNKIIEYIKNTQK